MPVPLSANLSRVERGALCAGCGACAALAPGKVEMRETPPGFLRPVQLAPLVASEEAAIGRVCPGLGQRVVAAGRQDDPLWGPWLEMQRGHASDKEIRVAASSGGALSALLLHLIESGQVDAVIQTAASPALVIGNATVISLDRADVLAAAGSRYAPSAPLADLPSHLASGRRFAFVGKPCDVAALRAMSRDDAKIAAAIPVMLSFFCAGVPSHTGGQRVLQRMGAPFEETLAFRYRGNGWPGFATASLADGSTRQMSYHDSWGKVLSRHIQHRCKICADGTGVDADIVCADAWESDEAGYPLFEEQDGSSLIVSRTALGQSILAGAVAAGKLQTAAFDVKTLAAIQPGQRKRRRALATRLLALRLCLRPVPAYRGLQLLAAARQNTLRQNLKSLIGMLRRLPKAPRKSS
jgi:coenzyme F420 hydrogenase subunit beta